ncbi:molybdopterin-guanine dinucleotide biosynthesis protein A [Peribacillus deserti]|uniref:Probable molybdenum cofactor guanylyltransferase n=1 Tax=Peribacillus deserti TaxID=673318 RepID=A0ABS2QG05_9BACI|nr:molybdenum cofactor guanylyltransferase [Peribacillus deserti]MBM7692083.1 molybdopterin-guanine dinucleotide biosynthesis protein A [Peribacillus deserti]
MTIAGIILAGGKSSRFGKPKMFETYKGKYFYEYSVDACKENSLSPLVIATNQNLIPDFKRDDEVEFIIEKETEIHLGPLFAMYHAMNSIEADWYFILSCDIPFVTSDFVSYMISLAEGSSYDAIVPIQAEKIHPLLALYHRRSLPKMQQILSQDIKKIRVFLDEIDVLKVPFPEDNVVFVNINRQEDMLHL